MADIYVDYSASNDGNGTTAAQAGSPGGTGAYNTLAGKTFSASDKVWVRRVTAAAIGAITTLSQTVGLEIIGWPISGDLYYSSRPASGTSNGWDADGNTYAILVYNSASFRLTISGQNYKFYRIQVQQSAASARVSDVTGSTNEFYDCYWYHAHATQLTSAPDFEITSSTNLFVRCKWEGPCAANNASAAIVKCVTGTANKFFDCTIIISSTAAAGQCFWLNSADHLVQNLTINITGGTAALKIVHLDTSGSNCRLFDILLNASGGVTSFVPLTVSGDANYISGFETNSGGGSTTGILSIPSGGDNNVIMITNFVQNPTSGTNGVNIAGQGNRVILKNGTFLANTQDINFNANFNNTVLCNNVVFSSTPIVAGSHLESCTVWSYNHNQTAGAFKHIHLHGEITSSNTYRSGGESYSFKFESLLAGNGTRGQLQLGLPGFETIWLNLAAGSRTVTLYGAHKNFGGTPPKTHNIWIEFEYLDANGDYKHYSSYAYGTTLTSDSSTWNNDTSLTVFKIDCPVTVDAQCIVPVRIYYHAYVASAYTYVDPKIGVA